MTLEIGKRPQWKSKLGFILATSGAAVGLGNIQRFPYITAEGGGAVFVIVYLLCVFLLGMPLILSEFALGRHTKKNPFDAIKKIAPNSKWKWVGAINILTAFFILSYYSVIGGWAIGYVFLMFSKASPDFTQNIATPSFVFPFMMLFLLIVSGVVVLGVKKGIEKYSKIWMPIFFVLMLMLIVRSLTLPGASIGLKYYLKPDWSQFSIKVLMMALGQAFFSLCVGEAVLVTYGSYTSKKENLLSSSISVTIFDTLVALLSGLMIFPAIFAFGKTPHQGLGLTFVVLPEIFEKMFMGHHLGVLFFILLSLAGLTTGIALLEIPVMYLMDAKKWTRKKGVIVVSLTAFVLGIPSALSHGIIPSLSQLSIPHLNIRGFLDIMDFIWGNLGMVVGGGLLTVFCGWVWGAEKSMAEWKIGSGVFLWYAKFWMWTIKYLAPLAILAILVTLFL